MNAYNILREGKVELILDSGRRTFPINMLIEK